MTSNKGTQGFLGSCLSRGEETNWLISSSLAVETFLSMTCFSSRWRIASIAVRNCGDVRTGIPRLTERTYETGLTVLRGDSPAQLFPRGLPIWVVPRTESVPMALNLMVMVPPPQLVIEERADFFSCLHFPNGAYAGH